MKNKSSESDFHNVIVSYNTIHDLKVSIPVSRKVSDGDYGYNVYELIEAFATSFVNYMTNNAFVSDDVLISSIGASNVREAMKLGFNEQCKNETIREVFNEVLDSDSAWKSAVLGARYGQRKSFIMDCESRGISPRDIDTMIDVMEFDD